jgi:hypothetical protein
MSAPPLDRVATLLLCDRNGISLGPGDGRAAEAASPIGSMSRG